MKTIIFSIYDKKAKGYRSIFSEDNHETAKRALIHAINESDNELSRNSADFALYQLGYYDHTDGRITPDLELIVDLDQLDHRFYLSKDQYDLFIKLSTEKQQEAETDEG